MHSIRISVPALLCALACLGAPLQISQAANKPDRAEAAVTSNVPAGFRSQMKDLGDARIHYVIGGEGPPILLVHGWPETWYEWRKMMPALAKRFTVIAPDLRGMGDSSLERTGYDKKTLATDLHHLMVKLGYPKATLVGHDWGASVGYAYAAQYRDAVTRLVLIEGIAFGPWVGTNEPYWFFSLLRLPDQYAERLIAGREKQFLSYFYRNDAFHVVPGAFDDASIAVYERSFARPGRMDPSYGLYRTIDQDVKDNIELAKTPLAMPVLAIGAQQGGGDFIIKATRAVAPGATPLVFENTGHFIPEERPAELVGVIEDFIDGKPVPAIWKSTVAHKE
jgi:pimeloyl-ACP methyl ester carboxylesterase